MAKVCSLMLIVLCGCSAAGQLDTAAFLAEVDKLNQPVVSKIDSNTETLAEIQSSINTFATKQLELDEQIVSLLTKKEASLVVSDPEQGKEVIKSEDTSPGDNANDSQPVTRSVAEPGDVPLFVSVAPFCRPCELLKNDWKAGKLKGFDVKFCVQTEAHAKRMIDDGIEPDRVIICVPSVSAQEALLLKGFKPNQIMIESMDASPYPAIRYKSDQSVTGWKWHTPRGYGPRVLMELRSTLLGEETPDGGDFPQAAQTETPRSIDLVGLHNQLHGGGNWTWPGDLATHLQTTHGVMLNGNQPSYVGSQTYRSRSVVRSVPYRSTGVWRSRSVSRSSCPSGNCP